MHALQRLRAQTDSCATASTSTATAALSRRLRVDHIVSLALKRFTSQYVAGRMESVSLLAF
jgi:hypothetical protein